MKFKGHIPQRLIINQIDMDKLTTPEIPTVQEERINHEIKLVLHNGRVTLNGKAYGWLYVFGFATHILQFKAIQPIGKTDIYNVLYAGR